MKREEIEQLLADYASGEISAADMQRLEACFRNDPALKKTADELLIVWQTLGNQAESQPMSDDADKAFYDLLATEKSAVQPKGRVIQIRTTWLKTAAAVAACVLAFLIGRYTVNNVSPTIQYKTVYVKVPAQVVQPAARVAAATPVLATQPAKHQNKINPVEVVSTALTQQLRWVYASERMAAVTKLADSTKINAANLDMLALALREDPNPNVRLTIINALRPISARPMVQKVLIAALNKQDDSMIQSSIVDLLINVRSKQALPQMIALLDDKKTDVMVQNKIKGGIESFLY
jgi:hypothetical protein